MSVCDLNFKVTIEAFGSNFSLCLFLKYFKEEPIVARSWTTTNVTVFNADNSTEDIQLKTLEQVMITCGDECDEQNCTGNLYTAVTWLRECFRQVKAEVVSNIRNKIHQTWERPY